MSFDWAWAKDYFTIFGSIVGILGFAITMYQLTVQKPILTFRFGRSQHYRQIDTFFIRLELYIDNRGERGTTVSQINLLNISETEVSTQLESLKLTPKRDIPPHSSRQFDCHMHVSGYIGVGDYPVLTGKLQVVTTHKIYEVPFRTMYTPD